MSLKVHDSKQVFLSLGGRSIDDGRVEGGFVTTTYGADVMVPTVDASGNATVSRSNNESATIKIKLIRTSDSHRLLEQLFATQQAAPNGAPIAFELRDLLGARLEHADACVFTKRPEITYAATVGEVEWELFTAKLVREVV